MRRTCHILAPLVLLSGLALFGAGPVVADTRPVDGTWAHLDLKPDGTVTRRGSEAPTVSADGRYSVFASTRELVGGPVSDHVTQVWLHDAVAGTNTLVSRTSRGYLGNDDSRQPSISNDGRYVSFTTVATNLPGGASDDYGQIVYRYDRVTGQNRLVTTAPRNVGEPQRASSVISATGRYVVVATTARLLATDTDTLDDIYRWDARTGEVVLVSATASGEPADGDSYWPDVSADGQVVFTSPARNLAPSANPDGEIWLTYLWSPTTRALTLVSTTPHRGPRHSGPASISDDGRYIGFSGSTYDQSDDRLYSYSIPDQTIEQVTDPAHPDWWHEGGDLSYGGRYLLVSLTRPGEDYAHVVEIWDRVTGDFLVVTDNPGVFGGDLSADGRHLAVWSYADDLAAPVGVHDIPYAYLWTRS